MYSICGIYSISADIYIYIYNLYICRYIIYTYINKNVTTLYAFVRKMSHNNFITKAFIKTQLYFGLFKSLL